MGKLEEESRRATRKSKVQEAILLTLASGGRLGAELIVGQVVEHLLGIEYPLPKRREVSVFSSASRLKKKGLVAFENGHYSLTPAGEKTLSQWRLSRYQIKRPRKWDKKWRVVIFDIPEKKRAYRTEARHILNEAGFKRLQDSVWVYPYDCEDVIGLMKTDLGIGKYLLYMIVDQIESDKYLRMDFDLL